jgi:ABC-2 type transport system permease protein
MRTLLILIRKDFSLFIRDKASVSLTFIVPIALIFVFGQVFGINRKDTGPSGLPLAVVNTSDNPATQRLVAALQAEKAFRVITTFTLPDATTRPLTEADLRPLMKENKFRFALVIPADVIASDRLGLRLKVLSNPRNDIETQTLNGILQKVIFSSVPELLGQSLQARARDYLGDARLEAFNRELAHTIGQTFGLETQALEQDITRGNLGLRRLDTDATAAADASPEIKNSESENQNSTDVFSQLVQLETEQVVGQDVKAPAATRVVGGWAMMFLLFALSGSATSIFDEKKAGLYQRLLAAPVTRAQILIGKFCWGVLVGLVQLVALFLAGQLMFGIDIIGHLPNLIVLCIAAAAACTAFGMLLAAVAPTPQAASGLATFLILMMSAIGGAWFPTSFMPEFIQTIAQFTIVYWAMEGFNQVLWAGYSFVDLLPTLGILTGTAAVVMALAVWRFNKGRIFE